MEEQTSCTMTIANSHLRLGILATLVLAPFVPSPLDEPKGLVSGSPALLAQFQLDAPQVF